MKILIVNQHPEDVIGGSEIQCDLIATYLTRLGHEVVYFAVNGKLQRYDTSYPVEAGSLVWKDLRRVVQKCSPEVAYWRFNKRKFLPSALILKMMHVKLVFAISHINDVIKWSHKVHFDAASLKGKMYQWYRSFRPALSSRINHLGYYWVDGVVAQLEQQTGKLPIKKETVVYNSVDDSLVPFSWEKPFVLWAASIKPVKNPEIFIRLAEKFLNTGVDFLMVGKIINSKYNDILKEAESLPNFYYLGEKRYQELNGMLQQSLFLAHTCEPEGFPNIFIQAWMQGKPTVSLYYDPDRMIQENDIGYCAGNFDRFRQDVEILIANDALREDMGRRAKIFAQKHFCIENNVRKVEAFFQEICET